MLGMRKMDRSLDQQRFSRDRVPHSDDDQFAAKPDINASIGNDPIDMDPSGAAAVGNPPPGLMAVRFSWPDGRTLRAGDRPSHNAARRGYQVASLKQASAMWSN